MHINITGLLYTYLAEGVGNSSVGGSFRALKRGFIHTGHHDAWITFMSTIVIQRTATLSVT